MADSNIRRRGSPQPRVNARALAKIMLGTPAVRRRTLASFKYAGAEPYRHMVHYYQLVRTTIRGYFAADRDPGVVRQALLKAQKLSPDSKRINITKSLNQFLSSTLASRPLEIRTNSYVTASIDSLALRMSSDLAVTDRSVPRFLFLEYGSKPIDVAKSQLVVDVAYLIAKRSDPRIRPEQVELYDIHSGRSFIARDRIRAIESQLSELIPEIRRTWDNI
jgi:hypothetical protein